MFTSKLLRDLLYTGATTRFIGHTMVNVGPGHQPRRSDRNPGFASTDPIAVEAQTLKLKAQGFQVLMYDWYGPSHKYEDQATMNYFSVSQLNHMICIDGGAWTTLADLRTVMKYIRVQYLSHSLYERHQGKYLVSHFLKAQNDQTALPVIEAENPDVTMVYNGGVHRNQMGWIHADLIANLDWWIRTFGLRTDGSVNIPCFFPGFNDDRGDGFSVWRPPQVAARIWPLGVGPNSLTFQQCFDTINKYYSITRQLAYLQGVTVNDWDEDTAMEDGLVVPPSFKAGLGCIFAPTELAPGMHP